MEKMSKETFLLFLLSLRLLLILWLEDELLKQDKHQ